MKLTIPILLAALIAVTLLFWKESSKPHDIHPDAAPTQRKPEASFLDSAAPGGYPRERPRLPTLPPPEHRADQAVRVQIDRQPCDPERETESQCKRRVEFIEAFNRFREDSGISDEKVEAVVALLYDYQETARYIRQQALERVLRDDNWKPTDYKTHELRHTRFLIKLDARDALEELLTPDELRAWRRHVPMYVWGLLDWPYEPPLIVSMDESAHG